MGLDCNISLKTVTSESALLFFSRKVEELYHCRTELVPVDTGDALSHYFDSVIMAKDLEVLDEDYVGIMAGSSVVGEDFTVSPICELGEIRVHEADIKLDKPVIPVYPVSAYTTFRHFVMPMIRNFFRSGNIHQVVDLNNQMNDSYTLLDGAAFRNKLQPAGGYEMGVLQ
jgi:molybdopterin biosynthesis enzyme